MTKIYGVYEIVGEHEETSKILIKCFKSIKTAEGFKELNEKNEMTDRVNARRCRECGGYNKECPLWVSSFDSDTECGEYFNRAFHDERTFAIEEIDYEEKDEDT